VVPGPRAAAEAPARWLPGNGRFIDAGGYRLRSYEAGAGSLPVLIVPGAGDCAASWAPVAHRVASFTRVVSYDRAGLGGSDRGPPPSLRRYLTELACVIAATGGDGPLVLAGHALGGLIALVYAQDHPGRVAGLVLVDAAPEAITGDRRARAGLLAAGAAAAALKAAAPLGAVRLLLALGAMPFYPEQAVFRQQVTAADYRAWAAAVGRSFAGAAGGELRSVLAAAADAEQRRAGLAAPELGGLPLAVVASGAPRPGVGRGAA
jgi:pimeloyl-ACP methyl ester carboxylesterase